MTRWDTGLVLGVGALALALLLVPWPQPSSATLRGPHGTNSVDLGRDAVYVVEGHEGTVVFRVSGGRLSAIDSACSDHVCVKSGDLAPGRPIVCAPNGVVAVMEQGKDSLDAVSR